MAKSLSILVAEDEESDVYLLQYAFSTTGSGHDLIVVRDGKEAVDYLSGSEPYGDRTIHPLPALLLLDLKMPRMTGFDVLEWLRTQPQLRDLPAVVLTSSPDDADRERARELGAVDYLVKPGDLQELIGIVEQLESRWVKERAGSGVTARAS